MARILHGDAPLSYSSRFHRLHIRHRYTVDLPPNVRISVFVDLVCFKFYLCAITYSSGVTCV